MSLVAVGVIWVANLSDYITNAIFIVIFIFKNNFLYYVLI